MLNFFRFSTVSGCLFFLRFNQVAHVIFGLQKSHVDFRKVWFSRKLFVGLHFLGYRACYCGPQILVTAGLIFWLLRVWLSSYCGLQTYPFSPSINHQFFSLNLNSLECLFCPAKNAFAGHF